MSIEFTGTQKEYLERATRMYFNFKEIMLISEELDTKRKSLPGPLVELRNALDHLMRVLGSKFRIDLNDDSRYGRDDVQLNPEDSEKYQEKNLDKLYGHIYRAGYDVLDYMGINIRDLIQKKMRFYSNSAKNQVFPEYHKEIVPKIYIISNKIAKLRMRKDVDGSILIKGKDNFEKYKKEVMELYEIYNEKILPMLPSITQYDRKHIFTKIVGFIIGGVVGSFITLLFKL
ncbi:MAG: hypothetical protein ACTSUE_24815 [Promethearchaeota archaeon]